MPDIHHRRKVATRGPEARLYGACGGAFCIIAGVSLFCFDGRTGFWIRLRLVGTFIYAWTTLPSKKMPFILPDIGITLIAMGMFHIYLAGFNYMADSKTWESLKDFWLRNWVFFFGCKAYLIYASSALSGQTFIRMFKRFYLTSDNLLTRILHNFTRKSYGSLVRTICSADVWELAVQVGINPPWKYNRPVIFHPFCSHGLGSNDKSTF